jgi:SAM-dependent methyltransferase
MRAKIFHYDEMKYYGFGLRMGAANFFRNGLRLGAKKTLGKVLQPINSYTRFPEYYFLGRGIERHFRRFASESSARVLDVGSPKCFGLYLASHCNVEIHLTDVHGPAVDEARVLWAGIARRAKGKAIFSVQDARKLEYPAEHFDAVYSMSVIEHVAGETGDSESIREMLRVLKPGGLLLVTVPFGEKYVEQGRIGFQGAAIETGCREQYFFQRVYTEDAARKRIIDAAAEADLRSLVTISRRTGLISSLYGRLGPGLRGVLGFLNPILSMALNDSGKGFLPVAGHYSDLHSPRDIYGDLILACEKPVPRESPASANEKRGAELAGAGTTS